MIHSQICILNYDHRFKYHIEYKDDIQDVRNKYVYSSTKYEEVLKLIRLHGYTEDQAIEATKDIVDDRLFINLEANNIYKYNNQWRDIVINDETIRDFLPITNSTGSTMSVNESSINIYFPNYSAETYSSEYKYSINVVTYINGVKVQLCSQVIDRRDALATSKEVTFKNVRYSEVINVKFPDPWYICYSDSWIHWRRDIKNSEDVNNEGSIIYVELTPLSESFDNDDQLYCWINRDMYDGGSCCIPFNIRVDDNMHLDCKPIIVEKQGPTIDLNVLFNREYQGDIIDYLKETYNWFVPTDEAQKSNWYTRFEIVIGDDKGLYGAWRSDIQYNGKLETHLAFNKTDLGISSWSGWRPGLVLKGTYSIINKRSEDDYDELFTLISDSFPMTIDIFKYFIKTGLDETVEFLNLDHIHMQSYRVEVVNKINKQVIKVNKPDDYKANILKPIFVKSYEASNIKIHPSVIENICIDLNSYKSKVTTFYIKIEDVEFVEIGRTVVGVIFRVNGSSLPNKKQHGVYYILNEEHELVTTGNYTYIQ